MASTEETNEAAPGKKAGEIKEISDTSRLITLVAGDALAFLVFAAIGRGSHNEATGLAAIPQIIVTAAPFAAGWFIVSPFVGAYRKNLVSQPRAMAIRTAIAWIFSWPVALAFRGIFVDHAVPPANFAAITLFFVLVFLELWRWPFALNNSLRARINTALKK